MFICVKKYEDYCSRGETLDEAWANFQDSNGGDFDEAEFFEVGDPIEVEQKIVRKETIVRKVK